MSTSRFSTALSVASLIVTVMSIGPVTMAAGIDESPNSATVVHPVSAASAPGAGMASASSDAATVELMMPNPFNQAAIENAPPSRYFRTIDRTE